MFVNVHGEYSTGLPDSFELRVIKPGEGGHDFYLRWGLPYCETAEGRLMQPSKVR